jgi:argininosuccinate lyase
MWKGRFAESTAESVLRLGQSVSFDHRLFREDIQGSIAHARAQTNAGLLTPHEFSLIEAGLREIGEEIEAGTFSFKTELEDVHMNIEAELTKRIGPAGAKLHTARSRNDQVATDVRLWVRSQIEAIDEACALLQSALLSCAERYPAAVLPGYTHLQRGQPVLFGHHLLAYVEMLHRDRTRLSDARTRLNICPLGSGALAGSTINLDRAAIARELEFDAPSRNSMDAVSDRDFVAETLFVLALIGIHLSRLSEDIILWCTAEFGFATLSDAHTTGSSLMPQKKNPDVAELTRGKTGRLTGNLVSILTILKGLPMTYNRDLQEDKEPLFDSVDTILLVLKVNAEMIDGLTLKEANTRKAASDPFLLTTDLADYLVRKGIPFRQAHEIMGKITAHSLTTGLGFPEFPLETWRQFSEVFDDDVFSLLNLETALRARTNPGSPNPDNVAAEIQRWRNSSNPGLL